MTRVSAKKEAPAPAVPTYPIDAAGWKVLVKPIKVQSQTKSGILIPEEARRAKGYLRYIGQVVSMGPLCYEHQKFCGYRYCEVGDWVCFGAYEGQTIEVYVPEDPDADERGIVELRLLNDDAIQAKIHDPSRFRIYCD